MGGKVGRKAQVALFVLLGVILVIGVILAIYLINKQDVSTSTTSTPEELYADNPELAAEVSRMQERIDKCLGEVTSELIEEIRSEPDPYDPILDEDTLVAVLEEGVASDFHDCFYRFNTEDKIVSVGDETDVTIALSANSLSVTAKVAVTGEFQEETYHLNTFTSLVATNLQDLISRAAPALGPLANAVSPNPSADNPFFRDGLIDLYGMSDEGIYADLIVHSDGSCTVIANDYSGVLAGDDEAPNVIAQHVADCNLPQPEESDLEFNEEYNQCNAGTARCGPVDLPEGYTILSPTIDFDGYYYNVSDVEPGNYHAVALSPDGEAITQIMIFVTQ